MTVALARIYSVVCPDVFFLLRINFSTLVSVDMSSIAFLTAAAGLMAGAASGAAVDGFPGATAGRGFLHVPLSPPKQDALLRKRADVAGTTNLDLPNFGAFGYTIDSKSMLSPWLWH